MVVKAVLFFAFACFFISTQAQSSMMDVESLRATLKQSQAAWQPKDSWVNDLSPEQVHKVLGYKQRVVQDSDFSLTERAGTTKSTDSIDWRNQNGQNWVSPILNQGNCGSCVAFATVATLETQMNISHQAPWLNPKFSEEALFACGGGGCDSGWDPSSAADYLKKSGIPDEACAPYTMGSTGVDVSCSSACSDASSRSQKIASFSTPGSAAAVKAALKKGPLVTTLDVYADFLAYGSGIYKHTTGELEGGHAVSIVGFNDTDRYWIVRNSWGKEWGENGFVRVSYDDTSGVGSETWSLVVPSTQGIATIRNLSDHEYVSGAVELDAISTYPKTSAMALQMTNSSGVRSSTACATASCPFQIDSTQLEDGRYEAHLEVTIDSKKIETEHKYFYVVNKRPSTLTLNFQPESGLDLSKPVSGRPVFNVDAISSSVPFTSLTLFVKQGDKIIETRGADLVPAHSTLGWRTTVIPNGTYDIYLQGRISTDRIQYQVESNHFTVTVKN